MSGGFLLKKESATYKNPHSVQQLGKRAASLEVEEKERLTEEVRKRYIVEMNALVQREEQAWEEVTQLIANGRKIASVYDKVISKETGPVGGIQINSAQIFIIS